MGVISFQAKGGDRVAKPLTASELKKFREVLEAKRRVVIANANKSLKEDLALDPNELPDELDLASSESLQSFGCLS